jgi:hypothetical protein
MCTSDNNNNQQAADGKCQNFFTDGGNLKYDADANNYWQGPQFDVIWKRHVSIVTHR